MVALLTFIMDVILHEMVAEAWQNEEQSRAFQGKNVSNEIWWEDNFWLVTSTRDLLLQFKQYKMLKGKLTTISNKDPVDAWDSKFVVNDESWKELDLIIFHL